MSASRFVPHRVRHHGVSVPHRRRQQPGLGARRLLLETLEPRTLLSLTATLGMDFGDAPDPGPASGPGNYQTRAADNGPGHQIVAGLHMGASVDDDDGTLQNASANADDVDAALPNDEDGLINPVADLVLTVGTQPHVNVTVTNTTGSAATLYGWIDYGGDGVFNNVGERAWETVPDGAAAAAVTLVFPPVPDNSAGRTYARFRLSTDAAAADPTGLATDGEVEDHAVAIVSPSNGTVHHHQKISASAGNFNGEGGIFGSAAANIGDLDGDGVTDLAVGQIGSGDGGVFRGAVWILFLNANGTVKNEQKISDTHGNFSGTLRDYDNFGTSVASVGDLDGDGVTDLAVGAPEDDDGGTGRGAVWILFLNPDGTVKRHQKISDYQGNFTGTLADHDWLGRSLANVGDLDGDGVTDLAVGTFGDNDLGTNRGAVWMLFLNADGTVKGHQKISDAYGGFAGILENHDCFGSSVANIGDLDGDGVTELAVGAYASTYGVSDQGAVWILFLNPDGTVKAHQEISSTAGNFNGIVDREDFFGDSVASVGDLDGDGVPDLAVGARRDDDGGTNRGAVWVLFLNPDGTVKSHRKISDTAGNFMGAVTDNDNFGSAIASVGDLDGDGISDLAVGAYDDDDGGAVWMLFLNPAGSVEDYGDAPLPYPTTMAENGPRHIATGPRLGAERDTEADGVHSNNADADDTTGAIDDEDGVTFAGAIVASPSSATTGSVQVNLQYADASSNRLDAWVDFNRDGDWDDAGEQIFTSYNLGTSSRVQTIPFSVPQGSGTSWETGRTYARFRLSTTGGLAPTGGAPDGEVEDYSVELIIGPTVTFSVDNPTIAEDGGTATFTASLDELATHDVTVRLRFGGNATPTDDYIASGTEILIPAGSLSGSITVTAVQDELDELYEDVAVEIESVTNGFEAGVQRATTTIVDDDAPTLRVTIAATTVSEGDGPAATTATIFRNTNTSDPMTVNLVSSDVTEASVPGSVVIPAGQRSVTANVDAVDDSVADGTQTVTITASSAGNAATLDPEFGIGGLAPAGIVQSSMYNDLQLAVQPDGKLLTLGDDSDSQNAWRLARRNADGSADPTFGVDGAVATLFPDSTGGSPSAIAVQPDGKIVVVGSVDGGSLPNPDWAMARYLPDGSLDTGFAAGGLLRMEFAAGDHWLKDVEITADGKILVSGISSPAAYQHRLARFNADGTLDGSFGTGGLIGYDLFSISDNMIKIQPDGKILVAGTRRNINTQYGEFAVFRYHSNGSLDTSFSGDGVQTIYAGPYNVYSVQGLELQADGRVVLNGYVANGSYRWACVVRVNANGAIDTSFDGVGYKRFSPGGYSFTDSRGMAIDEQGKILVAGKLYSGPETGNDLMLVRLNSNGSFDTSFDVNAVATFSLAPSAQELIYDIGFQSSGMLVALLVSDGVERVARFALDAPLVMEGSDTLDVTDDDAPALTLSLSAAAADEDDGPASIQGTVHRNTDTTAPLVVDLTSSDTSEATVPATVTIPAGQANATFDLSVVDDTEIDGNQTVTITARATGFTDASQLLQVLDDDAWMSLQLPSDADEAASTLSAAGVVTIGGTSIADIEIALAADDPTELTVPATVTIPAGSTSARFDLIVLDDPDLDLDKIVTVVASSAGMLDAMDAITIRDNETATLTVLLPAHATEGDGMLVNAATVTASVAPTVDVIVQLTSSDTSEIVVPATVTIRAHQSMAAFDITVVDDGEIDSMQNASVTARVDGWTAGAASINVADNDGWVQIQLPADAWESAGTLIGGGMVTIGGTLVDELEVSLVSDDVGELQVAAVVTIPAGQTSAAFDLSAIDDLDKDGAQTVRIDGSAPGLTAGFATTQIRDDEVDRFAFDPIGASQTAAVAFSIRVQAQDVNGEPIVPFAGPVALTATGDAGLLPASPSSLTPFSDGEWSGSVAVHGVGNGVSLTVAGPAGSVGSSNLFDVQPGPLAGFRWSGTASPQFANVPFAVSLTAEDANGYTVTSFNGTATLSGWQGGGVPGPIEVLTFVHYADMTISGEYQHALTAISSFFTDYHESSTVETDPSALAALLAGTDVFLIVEQESAPTGAMGTLGTSWSAVLNGFVSDGGVVVVNSHMMDEHLVLKNSGLMDLTATAVASSQAVDIVGAHPLTDGVSAPFTASYVHKYTTGNGSIVLASVTDGYGIALVREMGSGLAAMIGTDYFTLGTGMDRILANAVAWAQGPGAASIPVAPTSATFSGGVWSGSMTVLQEAVGMYLRADAGSSHFTDSELFDVLTTAITVACIDEAREGDGVLLAQCSVSLPAAVGTDLIIDLQSDDAGEVTVPGSVTIGSGSSSATFDLTIVDDDDIDDDQLVTITGSCTGCISGSDVITVHDNETAILTLSVPSSSTEGNGLLVGAGTVSIDAAPTADIPVQLVSSDPSEISVPGTVTILAGATSATFDLTIEDDGEIDGTQTATLTARVTGWTEGVASIAIADNDAYLSIDLPSYAWESVGFLTGAGTVSIGGTLGTDLVVSLTSSDTNELTVPATVTIRAGETSVALGALVLDDNLLDGTKTVTVTASATGLSDASATTDIRDDELHQLKILPIADPQLASEPFPIAIEALNISGQAIGPYTATVNLRGAGDGGTVSMDPLVTTGFVQGTWSGEVAVHAIDTNVVLTADNGSGHTGSSNAFDVTFGPLDHLDWSPVGSPQYAGVPFAVAITVRDAHGYRVEDFAGSVDLMAWAQGAESTVVVTEINTNTDTIEFMNVTDRTIDMSGWRLTVYDSSFPAPRTTFTFPATTIASGRVYTLRDDGTAPGSAPTFYAGVPFDMIHTTPLAVLLQDGVGQVVDFMATGDALPTLITEPVAIPPEQWFGATVPVLWTNNLTYQRVGNRDNNSAVDWAEQPPSSAAPNANLTSPFAPSLTSIALSPSVAGGFVNGVWQGDLTVLLAADDVQLRAYNGDGDLGDSNIFDVASAAYDFGDAPEPYPALITSNGARHIAIGPRLGGLRDPESDGQPTAGADGDDATGAEDDEDGVTFGVIRVGQLDATVTVNVQNAPDGAKLDAWIDFNADGTWGGPGEQIVASWHVNPGDNILWFDVPAWAAGGETFARFRLSSQGDLGTGETAGDGEVEDYRVTLEPPAAASGLFGAERIVSAAADVPMSVFAADVDGDGDMDVLSASRDDGRIAWYENDGAGGFTAHTVSAAADYAYSVFAADLDGDGDMDVLSASNGDDKIAWYENDGSENFTAHVITTTALGAYSVFAADLDGDGDMDVLSASESDDKIAWYENDRNQIFTARTISTAANGAKSVFAVDLDGDGDLDVLSASMWDHKIAWYENDGSQTFTARTITTTAAGAYEVFAADVDGDGDMDVLSASFSDGRIAWYENDGHQNFTTHTITTTGGLAYSVFAADVDGDGDVDVLSASGLDDQIAWYENDGHQNFTAHTIATAADGAHSVSVADMDGDGDLDVLSASFIDNTIAWHRQIGNSFVAARHVFYNGSHFDGNDAAVNAGDDSAIATDKAALLPGGTATFANYTSYWRGINGIMVDIEGWADPDAVDATHFEFRVGNSNDPSTWMIVLAPPSVMVRAGAGASGSDRVTLVWLERLIANTWLQVIVKADAVTGLAEPDVFYFGNTVGDAGNSASNAYVDGSDFAGARDNCRDAFHRAAVDFAYDYNRDSFVDGADLALARDNGTNFLSALKLIDLSSAAPSQTPGPGSGAEGESVAAMMFATFASPGARWPWMAELLPSRPEPEIARPWSSSAAGWEHSDASRRRPLVAAHAYLGSHDTTPQRCPPESAEATKPKVRKLVDDPLDSILHDIAAAVTAGWTRHAQRDRS